MKLRRIAPVLLVVLLLAAASITLGGCANSGSSAGSTTGAEKPAAEPAVAAPTLTLVTPAEGAVVEAGSVNLSVETTGLKFVMPSNKLVPGEGHVHFVLDDQPVKMSTTPDYVYEGVKPGKHTLTAELVQNDTSPFSPEVKQQVTFTAK